jgi:dTDP-4-amino-4,6-dideoxygalactose transaminase
LQAAALNVKLTRLEEWTAARQANAERYQRLLTAAGVHHTLGLPVDQQTGRHVWNQYTVRIPNGRRDQVKQQLQTAGVGCEVYYPVPLHLQECFSSLGWRKGSLPETERAAAEVLSLPIFPELTAAEQTYVVDRVRDICWQPKKSAA